MRVRLDFPFVGVLLIIAHLVGETLAHEGLGFKWVSGSFSALVPVMTVLHFSSSVQCTTETRAFTAPQQDDHKIQTKQEVRHDFHKRRPRIIKELTMMNRQSCMAKILCGVDVAKPPTSSSSTVNDFSYIIKSFFDIFSFDRDEPKKKSGNKKQNDEDADDAESDETKEEEEEEDDTSSSRSGSRRKNSRKPAGLSRLRDQSDNALEALLNEHDSFFFKKRSGHGRGLLELNNNCTNNDNVTCKPGRKARIVTTSPGFMGYSNPRFDKTAYLNKKQLQIQQAASEQEKLKIAGQVADKFKSPRQCRLLNWLRPQSYTTTTTITTTSNDPTVSQTRNEVAVNTMCPFTVQELQKMIVSTQKGSKPATTSSAGSQVVGESLIASPSSSFVIRPISASSKTTPAPYRVYPKKAIVNTPLILTAYGETDHPDLELLKDPFYALVPPEAQPKQQQQSIAHNEQAQFQTLGGFNQQQIKYSSQNYQQPSSMQQTLKYFLTTAATPTAMPTQEGPKYSKYFYLNSDEPVPTTTTKLPTQTPKTTTTSKPKKAQSVNSDEEEDDDENNTSGEENNNSNEHHHDSVPPPQLTTPIRGGQKKEKLIFRIPSKIHVTLPSFRGIAAKFRSQNVRQSNNPPIPPLPTHLNPVDANSEESPSDRGRQDIFSTNNNNKKRQANPSQEKQLVFKTNLEYQERVKDQHSPDFIMSRTPPARLPPLPPIPTKAQSETTNKNNNKNNSDEVDDDQDGEEDEEESDDEDQEQEDEERSSIIIQQPKTSSKPQTVKNTKPKTKVPRINLNLMGKNKNSSTVLRHFLSDHGLRTLSTITDMFGLTEHDEVHPHDDDISGRPPPPPPRRRRPPPPKRRRRPPPPNRRRRRRPRPRPHQDHQQQDDNESDEEEDDDDDSDEKTKVTTKKPTPTTQPPPKPLHPLQIPPRIVAVPIFLEGKEDWEGLEKPHEEEFFEPKPKKKANNNKPEKYDYDYADSVESTNSGEGIDFGPGQKIQTEYSDIVDNVRRPGVQNPHNDRFVLGLPTTWENMFEELKRQKQIDKWKKKHAVKNKQKIQKNGSGSNEEEESEEEDEDNTNHGGTDDNSSPGKLPPPSNNSKYRPPPSHYNLEPID